MGNSKFKKIILILGFIALVILIAFFIWNTFFKKSLSPDPIILGPDGVPIDGLPISPEGPGIIIDDPTRPIIDPSPDVQTQPVPISGDTSAPVSSIASGGLTRSETLVSSPTLKATLSKDGSSMQFYNQVDGKFYMVNDKGDLIPLSDKVFHNVQNIDWAPNKTKAVLEYPDGNKIIYDFSSAKQVTLPKHWEDFSFSPDSSKLVNKSLGVDPGNRWLIISNSDGSQSRAIEYIGTNDKNIIPSWSPNNQSIAMYTRGVDFDRREVFFVGQNGENFKSTTIEGWGFEAQWSESGDKILYSVYSPKDELKPKLWIVNASGDNIGVNRTNLQLETWAEKCSFANNNEVYCAVPRELPEGAGLNPSLALNSFDDLYKINISTGQKELIATPDSAFNISSISVTKDQKTLFFTDYVSNKLHKINLQ